MAALDRDRTTRPASRDSRSLLPTFLWISSPVLLFLVSIVVASRVMGVPLSDFFRDPLAITGGHPLLGVASNVGILLWSSVVTVCVVGAALSRDRDRAEYRFFLSAGVLTSVLLFDDLFMVHEQLASMYLGISEFAVFAAEAIGVAAFLIVFRRRIIKRHLPLLAASIACFAVSLGADPFTQFSGWRWIAEDGSKLLGIAFWAGFFWKELRASIEKTSADARPTT